MPASRPRASFEPISPIFDLEKAVEQSPNFHYVDRISCDMIDKQGLAALEKLILLHVIIGGKPLVVDGFEDRLDPRTFSPYWLRDNCGDKIENARVLNKQADLPLTIGHYLNNMSMLTDQFFENESAFKDKNRQRVYLKDIDCPSAWHEQLKEHIPGLLFYLNESTGEAGGGPGVVSDEASTIPEKKLDKGIARAGDLMSSLPPDMRAENLMCYIGHEGTYTPSHREMCASLGQNIMVEASGVTSEEGKVERPGSSIWFMTESKDRHVVSEYWLSVLGHDIEVENHFAQVAAWKKAPFNVYVVDQRPGDFILIPPLAPHQVWNRGTRTMKVAWNRTTVETLEMALNEGLPRSRVVCRDEQYKNKAIVYFTLQKYSGLLTLARQHAARMTIEAAQQLLYSGEIKQLQKDFKRLFALYRQIVLSEMFSPGDRDSPKSIDFLPFESNVTCAYCRGNIFNRFLTCSSCKHLLDHQAGDLEGDPYDVCMDCYAMGRSCGCLSKLKWVEQFKWKELANRYETWRRLIISLDGDKITDETPLPLIEERQRYGKKTLAEVCKEQLKRREWRDVHKPPEGMMAGNEDQLTLVVDDNVIQKSAQKSRKASLRNSTACHVCCHKHRNWKMAFCTTCEKGWCYGSLFRGWDKMPIQIMEDPNWSCPHCLGICFAGACRRDGKMQPYEPRGTLLGHDTRKFADIRSVESLVNFSISNLNWLKGSKAVGRAHPDQLQRTRAEAEMAKEVIPTLEYDDTATDQVQVSYHESPRNVTPIDPVLTGGNAKLSQREIGDDDANILNDTQHESASLSSPLCMTSDASEKRVMDDYAPVSSPAQYPQPSGASSYPYPKYVQPPDVQLLDGDCGGFGGPQIYTKRGHDDDNGHCKDNSVQKHTTAKKPRTSATGTRFPDLVDDMADASKTKPWSQHQVEKVEKEMALDMAKSFSQVEQDGNHGYQSLGSLPNGKPTIISQGIQKPRHSAAEYEEAGKDPDGDKGDAAPFAPARVRERYAIAA